MINNHGGHRPGAGRKPGTRNKSRKPARHRRTVKHQVTFTPTEWETIEPGIEESFNEWARGKILKV